MKKYYGLLLILVTSSLVFGQNPGTPGSFGLFHTHQGRVLQQGIFDVYTNVNFYSKSDAWLWAGNVAATVGVISNFDLTAALRLYQTTNFPNKENTPGDLFITLKAGSFTFEKGRIAGAILGTGRIPTGSSHNYPFAEYASGSFEYGLKGAVSYYINPYLPHRSVNLHFNFGYWSHNEKGKEVPLPGDSTVTAGKSSSKIDMALSGVFPLSTLFDIRLELYGYLFTSLPEGFVYSAEDYAVFTPSIQYRPARWVSLDLGADIRLSPGERNRTSSAPPIESPLYESIPNYPEWKVQFGAHFYLIKPRGKEIIADEQSAEVQKMVEFYDMVERQKEKARETEQDVAELRKERQQTEKEIRELKKRIEGED